MFIVNKSYEVNQVYFIFIYIYIYIYVYMYVNVCIYMYTYIHQVVNKFVNIGCFYAIERMCGIRVGETMLI